MGIFEDLKTVANVLQEAGKVKELQQLLNAQKDALEMQNIIRIQADEIRDLKDKLKIKGDIFFEDNVYWLKKEDGSKEGPYCSACWDNDEKLVHLHYEGQDWDTWYCPVCQTGKRKIKVHKTK